MNHAENERRLGWLMRPMSHEWHESSNDRRDLDDDVSDVSDVLVPRQRIRRQRRRFEADLPEHRSCHCCKVFTMIWLVTSCLFFSLYWLGSDGSSQYDAGFPASEGALSPESSAATPLVPDGSRPRMVTAPAPPPSSPPQVQPPPAHAPALSPPPASSLSHVPPPTALPRASTAPADADTLEEHGPVSVGVEDSAALSPEEASETLMQMIDNSMNALFPVVCDALHKVATKLR